MLRMISLLGCLVLLIISLAIPSAWAFNKVLSLDGDGDYAGIPYSESLNISDMITLETWILRSSHGGIELIVGNGGGWGYPGYHLISMPDGRIRFELKSVTAHTFFDSDIISDNQWHHIVATYDGKMMLIYIDGTLNKSTPHENGIENQDSDIGIGFGLYPSYSGTFFDGIIDEVRIWNVARTPEEIQDAMNRPLTLDEIQSENLVGYWNFDDGMANDLSQYDNHGTLYGNARIVDTIYVSTEGDDITGDGTFDHPYRTIQKGIDESRRGDIVQALPGTYEENIELLSDLIVLGSGAEKTTITAENGEIVTAIGVHDVILSGFTIDGQGCAEKGILCYDAEIEVSNNIITRTKLEGILCFHS